MIRIDFRGQIRGGKNNVGIKVICLGGGKHTIHRFPNKLFAQWRDSAVASILRDLGRMPKIDYPVTAEIHYTPDTARRRDLPAIIDAMFHVLEKAGVVKDDCLIEGFSRFVKYKPSRDNAGAIVWLSKSGELLVAPTLRISQR